MKKKEEVRVSETVLSLDLNRFEKLIQKVEAFRNSCDVGEYNEDTIEILFTADGKIKIEGEYAIRVSEDILI